jgi:prefoldin subunit 5
MAAKQQVSDVEKLRLFTQRRWEGVMDALSEWEALKDAIEDVNTNLDEVDQAIETLEEFAGHLESLVDLHVIDESMVGGFNDAIAALRILDDMPKEAIAELPEAYDAAVGAIDSYASLKEDDPYPGKKDDLEGAWEEVQASLDVLADSLTSLGLG